MNVSIRKPETSAAIRLLAARTGLSPAEATDRAVRAEPARLDRARADETPQERLARMRRVAASLQAQAATCKGLWPTDDDLYGEDGLPR